MDILVNNDRFNMTFTDHNNKNVTTVSIPTENMHDMAKGLYNILVGFGIPNVKIETKKEE